MGETDRYDNMHACENAGLEHASMASRGSEAQRLCKRDQPINAYVWRDIYSVGDRKQDSVRERNVDGETIDRYRDGDAS